MLQAGYTGMQPLPSRSYSMSVPLDASRPGPSSSTPHQPMPRMIASYSMKVGFELKNLAGRFPFRRASHLCSLLWAWSVRRRVFSRPRLMAEQGSAPLEQFKDLLRSTAGSARVLCIWKAYKGSASKALPPTPPTPTTYRHHQDMLMRIARSARVLCI